MTKVPQLTSEFVTSVCAMVESGQWPQTAARALGVPAATFQRWLEEGEEALARGEESLEAELARRVGYSDAVAEIALAREAKARMDAGKHWQGHVTLMSRRWPARWAERKPEPDREARFEDELRAFIAEAGRAKTRG